MKQWDHEKPEERHTVRVERGGKPIPGLKAERISSVEEEVMYWRKANHIHKWFVDNVQNGVDNCASYYVSEENLEKLRDACVRVLMASLPVAGEMINGMVFTEDNPNGHPMREAGRVIEDTTVAEELLPTCAGFFFGSTEYSDYYLADVQDTLDWVLRMLDDIKKGVPGEIYYRSSW